VNEDLSAMRRVYRSSRLLESEVPADPFELFRAWLSGAIEAGLTEPNAMVLATADGSGRPSTRHVLLKELDRAGFVFYTNLRSRKADEIAVNPAVSLCFPWFAMERQVVVTGTAAQVPRREAAAYWASRPRESQLGAWASEQSTVIRSRDDLEQRAAAMAERFAGDVPLPGFWGGFRVTPDSIEFWQGRPARLHDRLRYSRSTESAIWRQERLSP
jgi:pyridoxamine 5'-phosphate oxidase